MLQMALITDDGVYLLINIAYGETGKWYKILPNVDLIVATRLDAPTGASQLD